MKTCMRFATLTAHAAVLALAGMGAAAQAQSGVALSGEIDLGLQHSKAANARVDKRVASGGWSASRLIVSGNEDLGGGMRAAFYLETGPNFDTGSMSRFGFWNRASWVGLSGPAWGELRAGRMLTNTANLVCQIDLHWCSSGFTGSGIIYNGDLATVGRWVSGSPGRGGNNNEGVSVYSGGDKTAGSADSNRKNNALQYTSPRWSGLQLKLLYALGEAGDNAANGSGNHADVSLTYAMGNLFLGAGYAEVQADPLWNAKGRMGTVGGTYSLDALKIGAVYQRESAAGAAARWSRADAWAITAAYQAGLWEPYLKFGQHKTNGTGAYGIVNAVDSTVVNLGALYRLSKRSALYADLATDLKGGDGRPAVYKNDARLVSVGMRHRF